MKEGKKETRSDSKLSRAAINRVKFLDLSAFFLAASFAEPSSRIPLGERHNAKTVLSD